MEKKSKTEKTISRRQLLPLMGSSLLIPFLGFGSTTKEPITTDDEEYQTLLKPDGTAVKVRVSALQNSKVIKKNVSNNSLLKWLGKKL